MLIRVPEQSAQDLAAWERAAAVDPITVRLASYRRHVDRARAALVEFAGRGPCYAGTSWGKDSAVIAHMVATMCPGVPLLWIRVEPLCNPHCELVRDDFLSRFSRHPYEEIRTTCERGPSGWIGTGRLERGFAIARERFGERYVSGIRADESGQRKRRCSHYGESSPNTCAPLSWWTGSDVFGYLHEYDLPVHPAYAMSLGGLLDRDRIRVASLGGERGTGMGRWEWERRYYRDRLRELGLG